MSKKLTIEELRKFCQTKRNEPFLTPIFRKWSIYVTAFLVKTKITANQVTLLAIALALLAGLLLSFGDYWLSIISGLILHLNFLLDHVDGEVARYRRYMNQSPQDMSGNFMEDIQHLIEVPAIFVGVTYGIYNNSNQTSVFALCFSALFFFMEFRFLTYYVSYHINSKESEFVLEPSIWTPVPLIKNGDGESLVMRIYNSRKLRTVMFTVFRSGFLNILVLVAAILNQLYIVLILHGILFPPLAILYTYLSFRQFHKLAPEGKMPENQL